MAKEGILTRREAMQGMLGAAVATMVPATAYAGQARTGAALPWPAGSLDRLQAFNDNWRFHRSDAEGAEAAAFDDSRWRTLDVPHDWSIEDIPSDAGALDVLWTEGTTPARTGPFDFYESEGQTATGWTVGGVGWYRKTFPKLHALSPDAKVELRFEGVYMNADVWLNGAHLGNHPYGYTEFAFDLTPHLNDGQNTVAVRVNNAGRNSRWYSGSGIYRKVWLLVAWELRIPAHGIYVTTVEASPEAALVHIEVSLENSSAAARQGVVRARLVEAGGTVAGEARESVTVPAGAGASTTLALDFKRPRLWSPNDANLYRAEVVIEADGKLADSATVSVGVRKLEIDAAQGLRINGQSFKLHGGCVHHDNGPLGSACIPRAEERRVENLKASGYNAIRTSHNPPSRDFLDACDRLGMMVRARRDDVGARSAGPARHLEPHRGGARPRGDDPPGDALHGRSRAAMRPSGSHRRRASRRARQPGRTGRAGPGREDRPVRALGPLCRPPPDRSSRGTHGPAQRLARHRQRDRRAGQRGDPHPGRGGRDRP